MPKAKETPLTPSKLEQFRIASNRVSLESIKYAAEIVGYTDLITATVAALEKLIETGSAHCPVNLSMLYQKATSSNSREEPLLHAIRIALAWACSDGSGQFLIGNSVDLIYAARLKRREKGLANCTGHFQTPYIINGLQHSRAFKPSNTPGRRYFAIPFVVLQTGFCQKGGGGESAYPVCVFVKSVSKVRQYFV